MGRMEKIFYGSFKDDNSNMTITHLCNALYHLVLRKIVKKDFEDRPTLRENVKNFIRYLEEQEVHVEVSREDEPRIGRSKDQRVRKRIENGTMEQNGSNSRD